MSCAPECNSLPPIFRYLTLENALRLTKEGRLRLNSPSFFHDELKFGPQIGDAGEAQKTLNVPFTSVVPGADLPERVMKMVKYPEGYFERKDRFKPIIQISTKLVYDDNNDALIYCCLQRPLSECVVGFEGDTWVMIHNTCEFLKAINAVLPADLEFRGIGPCIYSDREMHYKDPLAKKHPLIIKDRKYSHQKEVRAIWISRTKTQYKGPYEVQNIEITKYCRIVRVAPEKSNPKK